MRLEGFCCRWDRSASVALSFRNADGLSPRPAATNVVEVKPVSPVAICCSNDSRNSVLRSLLGTQCDEAPSETASYLRREALTPRRQSAATHRTASTIAARGLRN